MATKVDKRQLLSHIDIVAVIRHFDVNRVSYGYTKKIGLRPIKSSRIPSSRYIGLCPFHRGNTASMLVSYHRQIFHCYCCGEGGNAVSFLKLYTKSLNPILDLAVLVTRKGWVNWSQIKPKKEDE